MLQDVRAAFCGQVSVACNHMSAKIELSSVSQLRTLQVDANSRA